MKKKEYSQEIKEYRTRLAEALWENLKLKDKVQNHETIREMIAHDAKGPLATIQQIVQMLIEHGDELPKETIKEFYGYLDSSAKKGINIYEIVRLSDLTKKDIEAGKEEFYFENIALNNAHSLSNKFKEARLRLDFKYNEQQKKVFSIPNIFEILYSNIIGDSLNNALENTVVKSGIKTNENNDLELIIENKTNGRKQRNLEGLGKGYGTKNVNKILSLLDGKIEIYNHSIIGKDYDILHKFGDKEIYSPNENLQTYAKKIVIPNSEITRKLE